jgi:pimeloyl-ACP methyl ester carboxylesterase
MRILPALAVVLAAVSVANAEDSKGDIVDGRFNIGGRSIQLTCRGVGAPTVVVDAGMGTAPAEDPGWKAIAAKVADSTQVCLYDRAGLGASGAAPEPVRTSADTANDLGNALHKAGIKGPYLIVGHSIGGLHAQVFASIYPEETAGLVLVSSTHPDQIDTWLSILPNPAPDEEKAVGEARVFLVSIANDSAKNEERLDFKASAAQARALRSLGSKPVVIATHSPQYRMVPGMSEPLAIKLEAATQRMQRELLSLSSRSKQNIAKSAGHGLPHEDPAFVVDNILEAVAMARN